MSDHLVPTGSQNCSDKIQSGSMTFTGATAAACVGARAARLCNESLEFKDSGGAQI